MHKQKTEQQLAEETMYLTQKQVNYNLEISKIKKSQMKQKLIIRLRKKINPNCNAKINITNCEDQEPEVGDKNNEGMNKAGWDDTIATNKINK